ncbi:MAG: quinone-dependent dihydroorotate dehydrogenase [Candidatus Levybacteria bacterium]|nr:quinone-dependent dihydroorotate dehydrogenase [Candidatus Levybacteria bacterium]
MKKYWLRFYNYIYKHLLTKVIFLFNSELIHNLLVRYGEILGKTLLTRKLAFFIFNIKSPILSQNIKGITFENPIGLAAGFDYTASLTQILPSIGFGFGTVGTITNHAFEGNPKPRLARLLKSKSLMVNKGFKNNGIDAVGNKLKNYNFQIPIGISIGQTNTGKFTQESAVEDIVTAFKKAEEFDLKTKYYELNISCPNLNTKVTFYDPDKLDELLTKIKALNIKKPIFVKMPIDKNDKEALSLLDVISKNKMDGVIFGNLQKNRNNKTLDKNETAKYPVGNFSGKPTWEDSNRLIELAYKNYKDKLIIIGCGGVFNGQDAYHKIKLGASLVQFITGLIFEGPAAAALINSELIGLLKKDGYKNVKQAVGINVNKLAVDKASL